ncbi:MAG: hypothetical protein LBU65_09950 [Planctomycetaceae bacterium]|nr:hypothetical protein [Planctomycetaceae bacterium]
MENYRKSPTVAWTSSTISFMLPSTANGYWFGEVVTRLRDLVREICLQAR